MKYIDRPDVGRLLSACWRWSEKEVAGAGELRAYHIGKKSYSYWVDDGHDLQSGLGWAAEYNERGYNIAHGVQPRSHIPESGFGASKEVPSYTCLVLDFDTMNGASSARNKITAAGLCASAGVNSGRGMHLYFMLKEPVPTADAKPFAKKLCAALGSDPVFDPARIMRTPGTMNLRVGRRCTLAWLHDDKRYTLDELSVLLPHERSAPACRESAPCCRCDVTRGLSPRLQAALDGDTSSYRSRSEATLAVVGALQCRGASGEAIKQALLASPLGKRDVVDIGRCIEKSRSPLAAVATVRLLGIMEKRFEKFYKLKAVSGSLAGTVWWQHVDSTVEPMALACLGLQEGPHVTSQPAEGVVRVTLESHDGELVPRVRYWFAR